MDESNKKTGFLASMMRVLGGESHQDKEARQKAEDWAAVDAYKTELADKSKIGGLTEEKEPAPEARHHGEEKWEGFWAEWQSNGYNVSAAARKAGISPGHARRVAAKEIPHRYTRIVATGPLSKEDMQTLEAVLARPLVMPTCEALFGPARYAEQLNDRLIEAHGEAPLTIPLCFIDPTDEQSDTIELIDDLPPAESLPISHDWRFTTPRVGGRPIEHIVIPDAQCKDGDNFDHLEDVGRYIADKRPQVVVCLGDWWDMESLNSKRAGRFSTINDNYKIDIAAGKEAMDRLWKPTQELNSKLAEQSLPLYEPIKYFLLGNHEKMITEAVDRNHKQLRGVISLNDLGLDRHGWIVVPDIAKVDGINYSHYFISGAMQRPIGSASSLLRIMHESCTAGHAAKDEIVTGYTASGKRITGLIAGSCFLGKPAYLGQHGDKFFRGIVRKLDVNEGEYEPLQITLRYLKRKYRPGA